MTLVASDRVRSALGFKEDDRVLFTDAYARATEILTGLYSVYDRLWSIGRTPEQCRDNLDGFTNRIVSAGALWRRYAAGRRLEIEGTEQVGLAIEGALSRAQGWVDDIKALDARYQEIQSQHQRRLS